MKFVRFVFQFCFPCVPLWEMKKKNKPKKAKKKKMAKCWERNEENDDQQTEREKKNHWMGSKSIRIRWLWFPSTQVDLWPALQRPHAAEAKLCFIKNKRKTAIRNTVESQRRFSTAFPAFALFDFVSTRSLLFSQNKPKKKQNKTKQKKTKQNQTEFQPLEFIWLITRLSKQNKKTKKNQKEEIKIWKSNWFPTALLHLKEVASNALAAKSQEQLSTTTITNNRINNIYIYIFFCPFAFVFFFDY